MKGYFFILLGFFVFFLTACPDSEPERNVTDDPFVVIGEDHWRLESPGRKLTVDIYRSESGEITYSAKLYGRTVFPESPLGIRNTYEDFTTGLAYSSAESEIIDETYPMVSGKFSTYINKATELTLSFNKNSRDVDFIFRAYDDGVAVRYYIPGTGSYQANSANFESTGLMIPEDAEVYATVWRRYFDAAAPGVVNSGGTYEQLYAQPNNQPSSPTSLDGLFGMPLLYKTSSDDYLLYSEADLHFKNYPGVVLYSSSGNNLVSLRFDRETAGNNNTNNVNITLPFTSPWRAAVIGSLKNIAETMMIENLNPPSVIDDTSWIQPGFSVWTWLTGGAAAQASKEEWINRIDFAKEIGWGYVTFDDGWQTNPAANSYQPWLDEIIDYADQKGVGIIVWSDWKNLDTAAKRGRMAEWANKGIKGVKVDFFDYETPTIMKGYEEIIKKAVECRLVLNFHGSNKPTGVSRTYPNVLGYEAVCGAETHGYEGSAWQNIIYPFTKNAIGPMDFTPLLDLWFSAQSSQYTVAHNLALTVLFRTGLFYLADYPEAYLESPARDLFQDLPGKWDEMVMVDAELGKYAVIARRAGTTWYVGVVNYGAVTVNIPLRFLGAGNYNAKIYRNDGRAGISVDSQTVTAGSNISINMDDRSGGAIKITR